MVESILLALNAGSSSLKFAVFADATPEPQLQLRGRLEDLDASPRLLARDSFGTELADLRLDPSAGASPGAAFEQLDRWLRGQFADARLLAVGHRVVHGGMEYEAPVTVDDGVFARLEALVPLAPLHQAQSLAAIHALRGQRPELLQVACFDTAFHRGRASAIERFGLPDEMFRRGLRRYGFHGLSYEFITRALRERSPELARGRVVIAHLGAGASLCALRDGRSIDTTMGFSALDGLPMSTRCGSLDPGAVLHLFRSEAMTLDEVEDLLYHRSGLLGISGISGDMRELLASPLLAAREAVDYFVGRVNRELGALAAALGGIDGLVFTAGIGENSPEIRERICRSAAWLGFELDEQANQAGRPLISPAGTRPAVWVIPTDEERVIARHTAGLLHAVRR